MQWVLNGIVHGARISLTPGPGHASCVYYTRVLGAFKRDCRQEGCTAVCVDTLASGFLQAEWSSAAEEPLSSAVQCSGGGSPKQLLWEQIPQLCRSPADTLLINGGISKEPRLQGPKGAGARLVQLTPWAYEASLTPQVAAGPAGSAWLRCASRRPTCTQVYWLEKLHLCAHQRWPGFSPMGRNDLLNTGGIQGSLGTLGEMLWRAAWHQMRVGLGDA